MAARFWRTQPRIRSGLGQTLLGEPEKVDQLKEDMLAGRYRFDTPVGRIAGWRDAKGTYYIAEGHHRINAALEIYWETGDRSHLDLLLQAGDWENESPPKNRRLPTRASGRGCCTISSATLESDDGEMPCG